MNLQQSKLARQNQIYSKHLTDFAGPEQKRREQEARDDLLREERRKQMASQLQEQERIQKQEIKDNTKMTLLGQMQQHEMFKQQATMERQQQQHLS